MSDSVQPQRQQPTRLPCPWDSPGKNTGVGCHFLLQCMKVKDESEVAQLCPTRSDPMDCSPPGSSIHGIFQARVLEWVPLAFSEPVLCNVFLLLIYFMRHRLQFLCTIPSPRLSPLVTTSLFSISGSLFLFFFNLFILIGGQLLYNIVMDFAMHRCESAISVQGPPPS